VVVTAERPLFEQSIDKRVFNVEKSIVSEGGSATDILETIPSVSVDVEGNVSLRGSGNVTILIDGKPSGLTGADRAAVLQQIPAASIERIEVVTNPSARYDAEGMSGIINVVLKKEPAERLQRHGLRLGGYPPQVQRFA
jgi:outer membrane receptor for ferrienterochelin and colicin